MRFVALIRVGLMVGMGTAGFALQAGQVSVISPPNIVVPVPVAPAPVITPATPQFTPGATGLIVGVPPAGQLGGNPSAPPAAIQGFNVGSLSVPQMQQAAGLIQDLLATPGALSPEQRSLLGAQLSQIQGYLGQ